MGMISVSDPIIKVTLPLEGVCMIKLIEWLCHFYIVFRFAIKNYHQHDHFENITRNSGDEYLNIPML